MNNNKEPNISNKTKNKEEPEKRMLQKVGKKKKIPKSQKFLFYVKVFSEFTVLINIY